MVCYMTNCWNKVYGCEYQFLATEYTTDRGLVTPEKIPFWPAPDNAPSGCNCNFGLLYENVTQAMAQGTGLCLNKYDLTSTTDYNGCVCCSFSAAISAFYAICPNNNLDALGFNTVVDSYTSYEKDINVDCSSNLGNCVADYGVVPAAGGKFMNGDSLPSLGNQPFSTTGAAVTSPPGGPTLTWSILGAEHTIVAVSYRSSSNPTITAASGNAATTSSGSSSNTDNTGNTGNASKSSANSLPGNGVVKVLFLLLISALWMGW